MRPQINCLDCKCLAHTEKYLVKDERNFRWNLMAGGDCKTLTNDHCRFCYVHPDSGCDDVAESKIGSKFDLSCQACTESEATYAGNKHQALQKCAFIQGSNVDILSQTFIRISQNGFVILMSTFKRQISGWKKSPYVFSDDDCKNMLEVGGKSLIYCKDLCSNTDGCTAINYKAGRSEDPTSSDCVLRECPFPVKPPYSAYDAYDGHFMVLEPGDQISTAHPLIFSAALN